MRTVTPIRPAVADDAAVIADFNLRLAWETEQLRLDPPTVLAGVAALLGDPARGAYFVAESPVAAALGSTSSSGSEVVGQLCITYEWSDWRNGNFLWLQSVYVRADFRRQGVFTGLLAQIKALAGARGDVCGLRLYMERDNDRARQAYQKTGMAETHYRMFELPFPGSS